ncbi:MAG: polymerase subunit sigma-70 [Thermoleophilia bacterium]|nr:polymerase subunit sigma-70 [Thermoleophilia bacterium]
MTQLAERTIDDELERYRSELTGYCYRMLASPFEAEDAVQETLLRAWRSDARFEGRSSRRTWLYRIATNVCLDLAAKRSARALPMDLGPAREPIVENLATPEVHWLEPMPDAALGLDGDPERAVIGSETVRLAFVTAMQRLPAKQRAVLILRDVLQWSAAEVAELLETTVPAVNSALQRATATLAATRTAFDRLTVPRTGADSELLDRFVEAFEAYDMQRLADLLRDDALQSMPPFDLWLEGRDDVLAWWFGPGIGCQGSRLVPAPQANGAPTFGQYKPNEAGDGFEPWALLVAEPVGDAIGAVTFFLEPQRLFERFGLPPRLGANGEPVADAAIER